MTFRYEQTPNKKTRSDPDLDPVKMDVPVANGQETGSTFDHVTIVTIFGPKIRAQNADHCSKSPENLVNFWSCHDRDNFVT